MKKFEHLRHKQPSALSRERNLVVACPPFRSNVNLSRIVRVAACCGVRKMVVCGNAKIDRKIARDGADEIELEIRRSLPPVLKKLKEDGYRIVGLEQATHSQNLHEYSYSRQTVLVPGHERSGLVQEELDLMDDVIEIPVYGLPYSYNVATATTMALYEYCRQFPNG